MNPTTFKHSIVLALLTLMGAAASALAAPVISNIRVERLTGFTTLIVWDTDTESNEFVDVGVTTGYGVTIGSATAHYRNHFVQLTGLSSDTFYHFRVRSTDPSGQATSTDQTFRTLTGTGTGLLFVSVTKDDNGNGVKDASEITIREALAPPCSFPTYPITLFMLTARNLDTGAVDGGTIAQCDTLTSRAYSYGQLPPGNYRIELPMILPAGWTPSGPAPQTIAIANGGSYVMEFFLRPPTGPDTTPPVIIGVNSFNIGSSSATIYWDTNELADSTIEYGATTSYGSIETRTVASIFRQIPITGLTPNTLYHYRVSSRDPAGNLSTTGDFTFTTLPVLVTNRCDIDGSGAPDVVDVQRVVNAALALNHAALYDINRDGQVNVVDVQLLVAVVINSVECPS